MLRKLFVGHDVVTVRYMGWVSVTNGKLIDLMTTAKIDVLVTCDTKLPFQQDVQNANIAVIVMRSGLNRIHELLPLVPSALAALVNIRPGECVEIYS